MLLLIHPPIAKAGEPPAGITALAGSLRAHRVACTLLDANLEAQLLLINQAVGPDDTWTRRALASREPHLAALRSPPLYGRPDRYRRAVADLNRLLALAARTHPGVRLSLADFQDDQADPLLSRDLLRAAESFRRHLFFPYFQGRLPGLLEQINPHTIGISLTYLSQALTAFALLGFLRANYPRLRLILGGGLVTSWMSSPDWSAIPAQTFAGLVDHCIKGPGEEPLLRLFGVEPKTEPAPPDCTGLPMADYFAPGPVLPYAASRGCSWHRCRFCPETAEGARFRPIRPPLVLEQIKELGRHMSPVLLHLLDNELSPALLATLAREPPGLPWYGFARVHDQLADPDFCRRLRQSGCVMLKLGLESGSPAVLAAMDKGIELQMAERALTTLSRAGIATYVYLLFGTPAEAEGEARETLTFTLRNHEQISFLNLAIFNMPRTGPEAALYAGGEFTAADLSLYRDFVHPRGWDRRGVRAFLDREFKRQPQIAAILRRDPPLFTSNHAPFFTDGFQVQLL